MTRPFVTTACVLTGLVVLPLAGVPAAQNSAPGARTPASKAASWTAPKTPWGDPDLQGSWTTDSAYAIPLQRPPQFAGRAELTDEEFKTKAATDASRRERALKIGDGSIGSISEDAAWLTRTFKQTSLIVEPADGRLPPMTPEAQARQARAPRGTRAPQWGQVMALVYLARVGPAHYH